MALRSLANSPRRASTTPRGKKAKLSAGSAAADSPLRALLASSSGTTKHPALAALKAGSFSTPRRSAAAGRLNHARTQAAAAKRRLQATAEATSDPELAWCAAATQLPVRVALEEFAPLVALDANARSSSSSSGSSGGGGGSSSGSRRLQPLEPKI